MENMLGFGFVLSSLVVAAAVGLILLRGRAATRAQRVVFGLGALAAIGFTAMAAMRLHDPPIPESQIKGRPVVAPTEGFATSDKCQTCHPGQYASWDASYHSKMTQTVSEATVLGDFDGRVLKLGSSTFRLSHDGDDFWVDMPDIDAPQTGGKSLRVKRRIVLATGTHHMQAYWYGTDNTRILGLLPFVHNVQTNSWLPRTASFILPPHDTPTSEFGRWNKICLECHVTQGRLRPVMVDGVGGHDTQVAEFGITCESCHGPGEDHVASYGNMVARYSERFSEEPARHIVQPERLPHHRSAEVCGQCHSTSVWTSQDAIDDFMEHGFAYRPGDRLADTKNIVRGRMEWNSPAILEVLSFQPEFIPSTFWSDGMNRVSGREYNGLIETPCFTRGEMSCLSCHQLHWKSDDSRTIDQWKDDQLKPGMRGNLACTQCHGEYEDEAYVERHTHHLPQSPGSNCYNCHMSPTSYGLLKAIRSHQMDSPDVKTSVETGRPNACNQCHLDRTLLWTANWLQEWYGIPAPELSPSQRSIAAIPLLSLQGDAGQRALAAWSMSWPPAVEVSGDHWQGLFLGVLLGDPYPAVRQISYRSLSRMPGFSDFEYDPLAEQRKLYDAGNHALELWQVQLSVVRPPAAYPLLITERGPRMDVLLQLLQSRDDRPIAFAE